MWEQPRRRASAISSATAAKAATVAKPAVRGCGGESGNIEQRAAPDRRDVGMPVNVVTLNQGMNFGNVKIRGLGAFATFENKRRTNQVQLVAKPAEMVFDQLRQFGPRDGKGFIQDDENFRDARRVGQDGLQKGIGRVEYAACEMNAVLKLNAEGADNIRHLSHYPC